MFGFGTGQAVRSVQAVYIIMLNDTHPNLGDPKTHKILNLNDITKRLRSGRRQAIGMGGDYDILHDSCRTRCNYKSDQ